MLLSRKPYSYIVKITKNFNHCSTVLISFCGFGLVWSDQTKGSATFRFHFKRHTRSLIQSKSNLYVSVTKVDVLKIFLVFYMRYQSQTDRHKSL